jgi:hypothetical protein
MAVPANTVDLTTVAAAQAYLSTALATTADQLQTLITAISRWAMTFCSRDFRLTTYTEYRNGRGTDSMVLFQRPVQSVTSVQVDGQTIQAASGPPWQAGWRSDSDRVYLFPPFSFTRNKQNTQFVYSAGYVTPGMFSLNNTGPAVTLPEDLQQAVIEAVAERYKRRDSIGVITKTIAGELITFSQADLPKSAMPVFNAYVDNLPKI